MRDGEKDELENGKEVDVFQQYPLGNQENLVNEEDKEEKHERHNKGEQILSSYM